MRNIKTLVLLFGALALVPACGGKPAEICSLTCECEHCNDVKEDFECEGQDIQAEIASDYGCDEDYDAWAQCVIDEGQCDEKELRFSTQEQGSCSGTIDTMLPCMADSDCNGGGGNGTCTAGTCKQKACAGTMQFCQSDSDCSSGKDRCQESYTDLAKCIDDASKVIVFDL